MAAETMKVIPPALLEAAASAAGIAEKAAAPHPGTTASAGSPADDALATLAAGMNTRSAQLSATLAGKGPQVQATTQAGVAELQGQDQQNAALIKQLADDTPHTPNPATGIRATKTLFRARPGLQDRLDHRRRTGPQHLRPQIHKPGGREEGELRGTGIQDQARAGSGRRAELPVDRAARRHFMAADVARVTTIVDYENGVVVVRQNPSVRENPNGSSGEVRVAAPTAHVFQAPDGSVRIQYQAHDAFAPGIAADPDVFGSHTWTVNGDLVYTPGPGGVQVSGTRSDYPSMEIYQDLPDGSTHTVWYDKARAGNSLGPELNLPWHHDVGPAGGRALERFHGTEVMPEPTVVSGHF